MSQPGSEDRLPSAEFARLVDIMRRLRAECPWDRSQTHRTLRRYLLEETYEVLHALDREDYAKLREELGDLMLQAVFHAHLAQEAGRFDIVDVLQGINEKLIRRHPHVFADAVAHSPEDVLHRWENIKTSHEQRDSFLEGVPDELPALLKAARMLAKMRQAGLNLLRVDQAAAEASRGLDELRQAAERRDGAAADRASAKACLAVAALADLAGADAEGALRECLGRLACAFRREEASLRASGRRFADLSPEEADALAARLLKALEW